LKTLEHFETLKVLQCGLKLSGNTNSIVLIFQNVNGNVEVNLEVIDNHKF